MKGRCQGWVVGETLSECSSDSVWRLGASEAVDCHLQRRSGWWIRTLHCPFAAVVGYCEVCCCHIQSSTLP